MDIVLLCCVLMVVRVLFWVRFRLGLGDSGGVVGCVVGNLGAVGLCLILFIIRASGDV